MNTFAHVQGSAKRRSPGLVNYVAAVVYQFCLALPAAFMQPGDHLLAELCTLYVRFGPITVATQKCAQIL